MNESRKTNAKPSAEVPSGRRLIITDYTVEESDVDAMGILYYGRYSYLFDAMRKLLFREYGYPEMSAWEAEGWTMPIIRSSVQISRMARLGDKLKLTAWVQAQKGVRLVMGAEVLSEDCSQRVAIGYTEGCFIDAKTYRPVKPSPEWSLIRGLRAEEAEIAAEPNPEEIDILYRPPLDEADPEGVREGRY